MALRCEGGGKKNGSTKNTKSTSPIPVHSGKIKVRTLWLKMCNGICSVEYAALESAR